MKIDQLTNEQIEKAKAITDAEERLAYLEACGVELEDDSLAAVAGGLSDASMSSDGGCPKNPHGRAHDYKKTGRKRPGRWLGWIDDVEYKCEYCGDIHWALLW